MRYRLSTMLLLTGLICAATALYSYETSHTVEVDASIHLSVNLLPHPKFDATVSYVLIDRSILSPNPNYGPLLSGLPIGLAPSLAVDPTWTPENRSMELGVTKIIVPVIETKSPILGRELASTRPYDCLVVIITHDFGLSQTFSYADSWQDPTITIDLKTELDAAQAHNETAKIESDAMFQAIQEE